MKMKREIIQVFSFEQCVGAGETVQRLRTLGALAEDLSLIPTPTQGSPQLSATPAPGDLNPWAPECLSTHINKQPYMNT